MMRLNSLQLNDYPSIAMPYNEINYPTSRSTDSIVLQNSTGVQTYWGEQRAGTVGTGAYALILCYERHTYMIYKSYLKCKC